MIFGVGTDIVEVSRMSSIIGKWGNRFVSRVFSPEEISYCESCAQPAMHYAARFAAKESFLKSLGLGLGMGISLKDVAVSRDGRGNPSIRIMGKAWEIVHDIVDTPVIHLSLSHTRDSATAVVVLERREEAHA